MKCAIKSLLGFQYSLNLLYSWRMWYLISIEWRPHRQLNSFLRKKHIQYSLIGVWLVIALVALAHSVFEWPTYWSHVLPLLYIGFKILSLLSTKSRKLFLFRSDAWKVIFQLLMMSSHSDFLLKSQEFLFRKSGVRLNNLNSMSMCLWRFHLHLLGHSQNSIMFSWFLWKKSLRSLKMRVGEIMYQKSFLPHGLSQWQQ